jgi:biotin carboxylase
MTARKLLLLGCGAEQVEALRIARELGYRTLAFDNDPEAAGRAHADEFRRVDLRDARTLLGEAEIASPDGVFVHAAELAVQAARIADALGLPGIGEESARLATEKHLRIERLSAAGLRTPRFRTLDGEAPLAHWQAVAEEIGFPCVLKPSDQAGARGVEQISSPTEVADYHARRGRFAGSRFVCESLLEGLELSTESVMANGKVLHNAIARRHYDTTRGYRPAFIEDGHSMPEDLPAPLRGRVHDVIERAFGALGITHGVLKGDLLIDEAHEVHVLEMAARTSGGRFADTVVPLGTGVNILYPLIEQAMGDAFSRDWFTPTRCVGVSQRFFLHDGARRVTRWPRFTELFQHPSVHTWHLDADRFRSGRLPRIESHRERLGYVICTGETRAAADDQALALTRSFAEQLGSELLSETGS